MPIIVYLVDIVCRVAEARSTDFSHCTGRGETLHLARDLAGHQLLSNNSKWINFLLVRNANWYFDNVVLLGDALHTAHFSIGSGTKLALEDAITLAQCFKHNPAVSKALPQFETERKPVIETYQAAAEESMLWFENAKDFMQLTPIELAYVLMTRSGRIDHETLRRRDPNFIALYENQSKAKS